METLNLNRIPNGAVPVVHVSQYDTGRTFRFNLYEGASVYTLDGTETVECNVRKLDGNIVTVGVTNTSSNYIDVVTTEQMTAVHGTNYGEIVFKKDDTVIGTVNFTLLVEKSPLEGGIQSDSAIYNLETQVVNIVSEQYDSANVIFDAVPTAGHIAPYTVSSDGIKTMNDNTIALIPTELDDLGDVDITAPSSGEAVVWDGSKWVNGTVSTVGSLDDLNDVSITTPSTGESLRFDGVEWVNKNTTVALTQAEYDALALSGDLENNTHYVITDAPNLNPTASDIEYSSGVTVKQAIDGKANKSWTYVDTIVDGGQGCDLSGYNEVLIVPYVNNNTKYNSFVYPIAEVSGSNIVFVGSTTHKYVGSFTLSASNILTVTDIAITVWTSCYMRIWAR